jgi:hypothetical protein
MPRRSVKAPESTGWDAIPTASRQTQSNDPAKKFQAVRSNQTTRRNLVKAIDSIRRPEISPARISIQSKSLSIRRQGFRSDQKACRFAGKDFDPI